MSVAAIAGAIKDPSLLAGMFGFEPVLIGPPGKEIVIDVLEAETASHTFAVTAYPVESGADIADHVQDNPATLTLDCTFADMLFSLMEIVGGLVNGNLSLRTWRDKLAALYSIKDAKSLVNVTTATDSYTDYLIESVDVTRTSQTGERIQVRLVLRHVTFATSATDAINLSDLPADVQAGAAEQAKDTKAEKPAAKGGKPPKASSDAKSTGASDTKARQEQGTADAYGGQRVDRR